MKTGATVSDKYHIKLKKTICCRQNQQLSEGDNSRFFYSFTLVSSEAVVQRCLLKKSLWSRCFPLNFGKFRRTPFFYRTHAVAASYPQFFEFCYDEWFCRVTCFVKIFLS